MTAHPPRTRWHVETYDPLAAEWSSGLALITRTAAVIKLDHLAKTAPTWRHDGSPVRRRIVLETTTFEDLTADPVDRLARFPKAGFVLPCVGGQDFGAVPAKTPDGRPAIRFSVGSSDTGHAEAVIPLELLEEVIAGQCDIARQSAYTVAYNQPNRFPGDSAAMRAAAISGVRCSTAGEATLGVVERQFLTFALDLAADHMANRGDEFTDEDTAALARLRQLADEELRVDLGGQTVTVDLVDPDALMTTIRNIVRRGGAGGTQ